MGTNTFDVALAYDPVQHRCDLVFNGTDFAIDKTPASAMLFSVLADRRARPDDILPAPVLDWSNPSSLSARRGWPGDAFSQNGQLVGSRVWLFIRSKQTAETRQGVESAINEATAWLTTQRGLALQLTVKWLRRGLLAYQLSSGKTTLQITGPAA